MIFNFPKKEEYILVHTKFTPDMFEKIKDIAEREECLRADIILILLEGAIQEYYKQGREPIAADSPDEEEATQPQTKNADKTPEKLPKGWHKKEPIIIEGTPDIQRNNLGKPSDNHQEKINATKQAEDKHIQGMVTQCANLACPKQAKFIKGNGVLYKDKEYCSDHCVEAIVNGDPVEAIPYPENILNTKVI